MRSFRVVRELRVVKFMLKVCHFATVACWSETVSATGINQKPLVTNRVESDNGAAAVRLRKDRVYRASYPAQLRLVYIYLDDGEWWWWGGAAWWRVLLLSAAGRQHLPSHFLQPLAGPAFFIRFAELAGFELGEGETLRLRRQTQLFFEEREHKASSRYRKAQDKARREHHSFLHTLRAGGAPAYEAAAASKAAIVKSLGIDNFEELNKDTRVALMASFYAAAWDTKVKKRGTLDGVAQAAMEGAQAVGGGGRGMRVGARASLRWPTAVVRLWGVGRLALVRGSTSQTLLFSRTLGLG